ncbi:MAG: hypothetical protein ACYTGX_14545 [Planctomycetota bacterium]
MSLLAPTRSTLAVPAVQPGAVSRVAGLGCLAAAVTLRPLVPDGTGLWLESLLLLLAAGAFALHWIAAGAGFKPTWRRPGIGIAIAVTAVVCLALPSSGGDWYAGTLSTGARLACLFALGGALQHGDEASGGGLVRGVAAAGVLVAVAALLGLGHSEVLVRLGAEPHAVAGASIWEWPALNHPAGLAPKPAAGLAGPLGDPARLGAIAAMTWPLVCALFLLMLWGERGRTGSAIRTTTAGLAVVIVTAVLLVSAEPVALAAGLLGLVVWLVAGRRHLPMAEGTPRFLVLLVPLAIGAGLAFAAPHSGLFTIARVGPPTGVEWAAAWSDCVAGWSRGPAIAALAPLNGLGPGSYLAADAAVTPAGGHPAAGAGFAPLTMAVESGIPFALLWFLLPLAALACNRINVSAPAYEPMAPPPRPPVRTTIAAMAVLLGGAGALLIPLLHDALFSLPIATTVFMVWIGVGSAFACPERPGLRAFPPLLRAAALAGGLAALLAALGSDAPAFPSVALGAFVLIGAGAATPWEEPDDERPERPARPVARIAAWSAPVTVAVAALVLLPVAAHTDRAVADTAAAGIGGRLTGAAELERLPLRSHSATLEALRGATLSELYLQLLRARPTAQRAHELNERMLRPAITALSTTEELRPNHPGPPARISALALETLELLRDADLEGGPLGDWRLRLVADARRKSEQFTQRFPGNARAHLALARALIADREPFRAEEALATARAVAAVAPPALRPPPGEIERIAAAIAALKRE